MKQKVIFSLNKVKKSFTDCPVDFLFCDAGDRKRTIFLRLAQTSFHVSAQFFRFKTNEIKSSYERFDIKPYQANDSSRVILLPVLSA